MKKRETLKSIAATLGVTHTTVSNAFNRPEKMSKEVRKKILDYAKSIKYYGPNQAAKSLRTGKSGSIGVIFNDQLSYAFTDPYDISFLHGVSTVCEKEGLNIVLIPLKTKDHGISDPLSAMVDGYILNAPYKNNIVTQAALNKGVPIVVVDFDAPEHININTNDLEMMGEVTSHLVELGHRNIGIITFGMHENKHHYYTLEGEIDTDNFVVKNRLLGCQNSFIEHNVDLKNIHIQETQNNEESGAEAAEKLKQRFPEITAFICFSDRLAYGLMQYCHQQGLAIPADISITGFDDINQPQFAQHFPELTTVKQDPLLKGQLATKALIDDSIEPGSYIYIQSEFIIKQSTSKAP